MMHSIYADLVFKNLQNSALRTTNVRKHLKLGDYIQHVEILIQLALGDE